MASRALFAAAASRQLGPVGRAVVGPAALSRISLQRRLESTAQNGTKTAKIWTWKGNKSRGSRPLNNEPVYNRWRTQDGTVITDGMGPLEGTGPLDTFPRRHIGPDAQETEEMLSALEPPVSSLDDFVKQVVPEDVLTARPLFSAEANPPRTEQPGNNKTYRRVLRTAYNAATSKAIGDITEQRSESQMAELGAAAASGNIFGTAPSFIGNGYYGTLLPEVIKRDILQNPAWYTSYTPYQPEISQGRLESLLNFQTMVSDLTALPISNASLLDHGTAAAEAMTLSINALPSSRAQRSDKTMLVSSGVLPRSIDVMRARAEGLGVKIEVVDVLMHTFAARVEELGDALVGVMVQYPDQIGQVEDYRKVVDLTHSKGALVSCATDLLALTVLKPPGEWGADIAFGSAQRLGVPMGYGGPHAAFFSVAEKHKRRLPGRLVGVSRDRLGGRALRLALQTREQHIRREKATSNVCTAQALLANVSAMYAVYHGPDGLRAIAESIMRKARHLQVAIEALGFEVMAKNQHDADKFVAWDTVVIRPRGPEQRKALVEAFASRTAPFHVRFLSTFEFSFTVDEATTEDDIKLLIQTLAQHAADQADVVALAEGGGSDARTRAANLQIPALFQRTSSYLTHPVFNSHHSETEIMRYMHHLQSKDLSLVHSMIPLGSCTMKLNGAVEMSLITLPGFANIHPQVMTGQAGYTRVMYGLQAQLQDITGMDFVSFAPNSGAQGEFAGLRAIRGYHASKGEAGRDICLIPVSAHGTNPASAAMAGMRVVPIKCDAKTGNLDLEDLKAKCEQHSDRLGAIMVTYPSTFGVFEPGIREACELVHSHGGQVYMDGANMNAQIGLCSPGEIGADVCHLNLHKTFCIPHGGGGPGAGPICLKSHLEPYVPGFSHKGEDGLVDRQHAVSSSKHGSASILPISWAYNALMGAEGLKHASIIAMLNANYLLARLQPHYQILYTNDQGRCAHEFILDVRPFHNTAGVEAIDIAKRLQDYGFHAPTMSWPVANTLMIEPTESESKGELDRFADALIAIRAEIRDVEEGRQPRQGNVLKMAPHPLHDIIDGDGGDGTVWDRPYSRQKAAYPLPWLREKKFWPSVARIDDTYGDLNLFCTCPPVEDTTGGEDISSVQTTESK